MRGEGWRLTWEPTNMLLAVYDGYIESVACLGSREALPHTRLAATGSKASASLRKAATCCLALRGCRSIQYGGIPFVIRHMCMRGDQIPFRAFLVTHVRGPTHTWPWYTEIDPKGITSFEQARLRPTHTHRYMQVKALEFDPLFMTVRADSSPHLNRAYANLFDFRPNFRPAGPKPKASYNIGYIYI